MITVDQIRGLVRPVELLAPAGRWDVLEAVLDAGADAVYVGLKRFNMRMHRSDFHFTEAQLADALALTHGLKRRLYVTLNSLLSEDELAAARQQMHRLAALGVDALIVQDLATLKIAADLSLDVPLHASTMMNVHTAEQAEILKSLGISRIITSRDIDMTTAGRIGELAEVEVEYFVHGDMCAAQSGQCNLSGVVFGKSSNRGECMKPCRWELELIRLEENEPDTVIAAGHLLAIKDLCLIRHLPRLIHAGICGLKMEGRMRDAAYLRQTVRAYRRALDSYYRDPPFFATHAADIERLYRERLRELSVLGCAGDASSAAMFDPSGRRESLFLSNGVAEPAWDVSDADRPAARADAGDGEPATVATRSLAGALDPEIQSAINAPTRPVHAPELAVSVSSLEAAHRAVEAEADRVYLAAEVPQREGTGWSVERMQEVVRLCHDAGVGVGLRTPRVTVGHQLAQIRWLMERLARCELDYVLVHHLGTLKLARSLLPGAAAIADYGFNLLNTRAVAVLQSLGVATATVSCEAGLDDVSVMAADAPLPLELLAHGPIEGMLLDHCVIAMSAGPGGRRDLCLAPCRGAAFALRDRAGEVRPIVTDQYCRNHLLTAKDLATWPILRALLLPGVAALRIEGHFYTPEHVGVVTEAYRRRIDALAGTNGRHRITARDDWERLLARSPRPMNLGAYGRRVTHSRSTAQVLKELRAGVRAESPAARPQLGPLPAR